MTTDGSPAKTEADRSAGCEEQHRLLDQFGEAAQELLWFQERSTWPVKRSSRPSMHIFAMWNRTAARTLMYLTRLEREAITDSVLKIQSIQASLDHVNEAKVPDMGEIHDCLKTAHKSLRLALREGSSERKQTIKR